ncbi:hypothetical protein QN277_021762 [Acacia crassicarpa]|uniref:Retrotransposon Copia-like N-terminal domain-containing protein n=1 Tax=Acacia crassicarpa TaxID=499986 RepID=A0AAE1MPR6_9FABA|nr:hypothetical protein QN277_021762 [Acacia crassicarpa]
MAFDFASDRPSSHTSPFVVFVVPLSATDPSSHFYIHPNENPALVLVAPPLDGANYHSWSKSMHMALLSKNKLQFIDGSLVPPSSTILIYRHGNIVTTLFKVGSLALFLQQSPRAFCGSILPLRFGLIYIQDFLNRIYFASLIFKKRYATFGKVILV